MSYAAVCLLVRISYDQPFLVAPCKDSVGLTLDGSTTSNSTGSYGCGCRQSQDGGGFTFFFPASHQKFARFIL